MMGFYNREKYLKYNIFQKYKIHKRNIKREEDKEKKYSIEYLKAAHKHSIFHKQEIMESELCGCFN